jgi:PmbA protein
MQDEIVNYLLEKLAKFPNWKHHIVQNEWQTDFLRFYQSQTNYNISKSCNSLDVSIYYNKKSYSFSIDQPTNLRIDSSIANVEGIIDNLPEDPDFVDVETDLSVNPLKDIINNIQVVTLDKKICILKAISDAAEQLNFQIYGTFICNYQHSRILNSNGIDKQQSISPIYFEVKAVHNQTLVTVLQTYGGDNLDDFDLKDFIAQLNLKMQFALNPRIDVEPGSFDVILAPRCIAELMQYLSGGMSARSYDQKSSYFEDKINQKVFPDYISVKDDPDEHGIISIDYNNDGHIYRPLALIDKGVFKNFMCSNYYSHKTGLPKNGNNGSCLVLEPGKETLEKLLASVDKGLYISSLHYMNFINEKETSITGLTRDGTFLIEQGKITKVVNNLRFTEKIVSIFENIVSLESKSYSIPFSENYEFFGISCVKSPHVLVKNFNITSSTKTI